MAPVCSARDRLGDLCLCLNPGVTTGKSVDITNLVNEYPLKLISKTILEHPLSCPAGSENSSMYNSRQLVGCLAAGLHVFQLAVVP
jgi:hypothetical protein